MQTFKFFHGYINTNWIGDFPILTRVVTTPLFGDIVPVQPMNGPTGQIFYLDYTYNDNE